MTVLKFGSQGPTVELLQLALNRAGFDAGATDGIFGIKTQNALKNFQIKNNLKPDGIAGSKTHRALMPWYLGYVTHTLVKGDSLYKIAMDYATSLRAIETANPGLDPLNLTVGTNLVVPLNFDVVPTTISYGSTLISYCVRGLASRYPFLVLDEMGRSVMGRPLYYITAGKGDNRVFFSGSWHANEWMTTPVLLKYIEELSKAYSLGREICGMSAAKIFKLSTLYIAPAINPDGIDLVTGELNSGVYYNNTKAMAENYPAIPFPDGWKANILGIDLNLQFPAEWEKARQIKFAQGYISPGPRDYVGSAPLTARESRAAYDFTRQIDPALILAYHTQGEVIYWQYLDYEPEGSRAIADALSRASGYLVASTPYGSGFAGYKDWFISDYDRPGYTIEAGLGTNPLPISQFDKIYEDNRCLLTTAATIQATV
ncbi:MAG: M14 family metallopeptidase [Oscillospiraceae bacterium]